MSNNKAFELNNPNASAVHRYSYPLAAGETIGLGQWFTLDASGAAVLTGATPNGVMFQNFQASGDPSVKSLQGDNLFGGSPAVEIQTGGVVGLEGKYRGSVDSTAYDDGQTYNQFDALTAKAGKLTPAGAGEAVVAYVEKPIGADARLAFIVR